MDKNDIENIMNSALKKLVEEDLYLLKRDVNERTITHQFAIYLAEEMNKEEDWNVDVEYNRNGDDPKRIEAICDECFSNISIPTYDLDAKTVYPDIIIHERGSHENNLLIIEIKKREYRNRTEFDEGDECKIKAFMDPHQDYKYQFGIQLNFIVGESSNHETEKRWEYKFVE